MESYEADQRVLKMLQEGDHAGVIGWMPEYRKAAPEGKFGHYLMMAAAMGGSRCQAPGEPFSEYEASVGTGQVHVWFERPADGWTGGRRPSRRPASRGRGGPRGREDKGNSATNVWEAEAVARRRRRAVRRVHGAGLLGRIPDPTDRGGQRCGQGCRRRGTAGGAARRDRCVRARLDRGAVREEDPRGRVALRLRVERAGEQRRSCGRVAVLQRNDGAHGRLGRADRRIHPRHPHCPRLPLERRPLPIWAWSALFALGAVVVLYFGVQISTRVQLTLALIRRRRAGLLRQGHRRGGQRQRLREGVQPSLSRTGSAGSSSACSTGC